MSSRAIRYELNRKGWLASELRPRYYGGPQLYSAVERVAAGCCFDQFERDARDRANLVNTDDPKFPNVASGVASTLDAS